MNISNDSNENDIKSTSRMKHKEDFEQNIKFKLETPKNKPVWRCLQKKKEFARTEKKKERKTEKKKETGDGESDEARKFDKNV